MNNTAKTIAIALMAAASMSAAAQTINIVQGNVVTAIEASADKMTYSDSGATLTVGALTYSTADIDRIYIDQTAVEAATVSVLYSGTTATVTVSGDIAPYITATVSGAHVSITQSNDVAEEITYSLSGTSTDGEFYMAGSYKATVELRGLTLTNATPVYSGAAICIMNGKRIDLSVKSGTTNAVTDCASPASAVEQKSAIYCKGHLEIKGKGQLTVNGLYAHAIKSAEYMSMKNATVTVAQAVKDGISCDEYFLMESGTLTISGVGDDGIQCDLDGSTNTGETTDHEDEDSGNIYIDGGTISITTTAAGAKGIKADSTLVINDGSITINASGSVDTSDSSDPSYVAALAGGKVVINGGTIDLTVKGAAGRGVKAYDVVTNGGTLTINNSGAVATVNSDVKGAKGIKALNAALNAGTITINMTSAGGKGIRVGDGTQSGSSGGGGGWRAPGGGGNWGGGGNPGGQGGGMGGGSTWSNITGSYTQGTSDGSGPTLTITTSSTYNSSASNKAIKAICAATLYGGTTEINTGCSGAEGLESKTSVTIAGGKHYLKCYDDCINSAGKIIFNGGVTVAYSTGNDVIDSNAGTTGAITIGNGTVLAYMTKGDPDEAFDCDNNNYIQITGKGIAIGAGGAQSSTTGTISGAAQGYAFPGTVSFKANVYNTLANSSGTNLVTFMLPVAISSKCTFITATGMTSGSSYTIKSSTTAPTDATTAWHGLYLGSSHTGTTSVASFSAK
ncbi:MAG: carbohydrate-binding domain-containing protein [Bacteroidaceae bacterium]|nr:carbohydrate-binding domain-containing protein [Bacteroidaceae bacterium]